MSDWMVCAGCGRRFYVGFISPERWQFRGEDGAFYCDTVCRKQSLDAEEYRRVKKSENERLIIRQEFFDNAEGRYASEILKFTAEEKRKRGKVLVPGVSVDARFRRASRREERIKNGLCVRCGGERDNPKYLNCAVCRAKLRQFGETASERCREKALCHNCRSPVLPREDGKIPYYCDVCHEKRELERKKRMMGK